MAFDFTLRTQESSYLPTNAPSADNIYNALSSVQLPEGTNWVGPVAKISRYKLSGSLSWKTDVVWVFEVQGLYAANASQAQQIANQVAVSVDRALAPLSSDWSRATMVPYNESTQGPLSGWQSGHSAVPSFDSTALDQAEAPAVAIQDATEQGAKDLATFTNRTGQAVGNTLGSTVSGIAGGLFGGLFSPSNPSTGNLLKVLGIGAGVLVLAVVVPPLLTARSISRAVRRNPTLADRIMRSG